MYIKSKGFRRFLSIILALTFMITNFPINMSHDIEAAGSTQAYPSTGSYGSSGGSGAAYFDNGDWVFDRCAYLYPVVQPRGVYVNGKPDGILFSNKNRSGWPGPINYTKDWFGYWIVLDSSTGGQPFNTVRSSNGRVFNKCYGCIDSQGRLVYGTSNWNVIQLDANGAGKGQYAGGSVQPIYDAIGKMFTLNKSSGHTGGKLSSYMNADTSFKTMYATDGYNINDINTVISDLGLSSCPDTKARLENLQNICQVKAIRFWDVPYDDYIAFGTNPTSYSGGYKSNILSNAIANLYLLRTYIGAAGDVAPEGMSIDECMLDCLNYWTGVTSKYEYLPILEDAVAVGSPFMNVMVYAPYRDVMNLYQTISAGGTFSQFSNSATFNKSTLNQYLQTFNGQKRSAPQNVSNLSNVVKFSYCMMLLNTAFSKCQDGLLSLKDDSFLAPTLVRDAFSKDGTVITSIPGMNSSAQRKDYYNRADMFSGFGTISAVPGSGSPPPSEEAKGSHQLIAAFATSSGSGSNPKGISDSYDWLNDPKKAETVKLGDTSPPAGTNIKFEIDTNEDNLRGIAQLILADKSKLPDPPTEGSGSTQNLYLNYAKVTLHKEVTSPTEGEDNPQALSLDSSGGSLTQTDSEYDLDTTYYPLFINPATSGSNGGSATIPMKDVTVEVSDSFSEEGAKSLMVIKINEGSRWRSRNSEYKKVGAYYSWHDDPHWGTEISFSNDFYAIVEVKGNGSGSSYLNKITPVNKIDLTSTDAKEKLEKGSITYTEITSGKEKEFCDKINELISTGKKVRVDSNGNISGGSSSSDGSSITWFDPDGSTHRTEHSLSVSSSRNDSNCLPNSTLPKAIIGDPSNESGSDTLTGGASVQYFDPSGHALPLGAVCAFQGSGTTIKTGIPLCSNTVSYNTKSPEVDNKTGQLKIEQGTTSSAPPTIISGINKNTTEAEIVEELKKYTHTYLVKKAPMVINYSEFSNMGSYIWSYDSTMSLVFTIGTEPGKDVTTSVNALAEMDMGTSKDSVALTVSAKPIIAEWHNEPVAFAEVKQGKFTPQRDEEFFEAMQGVPTWDGALRADTSAGVNTTSFYVNVGGTPLFIGVEAEMDSVQATREWTLMPRYRVHKHKHKDGDCNCEDYPEDGNVQQLTGTWSGSYWNLHHIVVKPVQNAVLSDYNIMHRDSGSSKAFYSKIFTPADDKIAQVDEEMVINFKEATTSSSTEGTYANLKKEGVGITPQVQSASYDINGHKVDVKVEYVHFNNVVTPAKNTKKLVSTTDISSDKGAGTISTEESCAIGDVTDKEEILTEFNGNADTDAFGVTLPSGTHRGSAEFYKEQSGYLDLQYQVFNDHFAFINSDSCVITVTIDDTNVNTYPILSGFSYKVPLLYRSTLRTIHNDDCCGCKRDKLSGGLKLNMNFNKLASKITNTEVRKLWKPSDTTDNKTDGGDIYDWPLWDRQYAVPTVGYNGHPDENEYRNNSYTACESADLDWFKLIRYDKEDYKTDDEDDDHAKYAGYGQLETDKVDYQVKVLGDVKSPISISRGSAKSRDNFLKDKDGIFDTLYKGKGYISDTTNDDFGDTTMPHIKFVDPRIQNGRIDFLGFHIFSATGTGNKELYKDGSPLLSSEDIAKKVDTATEDSAGNISTGLNIACRWDFGSDAATDYISVPGVDNYLYDVFYNTLEYLDYRDTNYTQPGKNRGQLKSGWYSNYPEWTDVDADVTTDVDYTRNLHAGNDAKDNRVVRQGINPIIIHNPISVQDTYVSVSKLDDQRVSGDNAYETDDMKYNVIDTGFTLHIGTGIDFSTLNNNTPAKDNGLLFSNMYAGGNAVSTPDVDNYYTSNQPANIGTPYSFKNRYQSDRVSYVYGDNYGIIGKGYEPNTLDKGENVVAAIYNEENNSSTWNDKSSSSKGTGTSHYIANIIIECPINVIYRGGISDPLYVGTAKVQDGTYIPAGTTLSIKYPTQANYNLHFVVAPDQKDCSAATFNVTAQAVNDPGNAIDTPYLERYEAVKSGGYLTSLTPIQMKQILQSSTKIANRADNITAFAYRTCHQNGDNLNEIYSKHEQYEANLVRAGMNTAAHFATKSMAFDVIGRIGNITVDDVEDPNFQNYFREGKDNSYVTTHNSIFNVWESKIINQTQVLSKYFGETNRAKYKGWLPVSNVQSTDKVSYPKLGYEFNYSVQTIGGYNEGDLTIIPEYKIGDKVINSIFYNTGNNSYTQCYKKGEPENTYHIFKNYGSPRSKVNLRGSVTGDNASKVSEVLQGYMVDENGKLTAIKSEAAKDNRIVNIGTLAKIILQDDYNKYSDGNTHVLPTTNYTECNITKVADKKSTGDYAVVPAEKWPADKISASGVEDKSSYQDIYVNSGDNHQRWTGALKLPSSSVFYDTANNKINLNDVLKTDEKLLISFDIKTDPAVNAEATGTYSISPDWSLKATSKNQITDDVTTIPPKNPGTYPEVKLIEGSDDKEITPPGGDGGPVPIILFDITQTSASDLTITGTH